VNTALVFVAGGDQYRYTRDLARLDSRRPSPPPQLPQWLTKVVTPLIVSEWRRQLQQHPDTRYKDYILEGIQQGFRIGFRYRNHTCQAAGKNMRSALDNAGVVDQYLANKVWLKRVVGPIAVSMLPGAMVSSFGFRPVKAKGEVCK